jgi:hypothetical protein
MKIVFIFLAPMLLSLSTPAMQQPQIGEQCAAMQEYRKNRDTILEMLVEGHLLQQSEPVRDALLIQCRNKYLEIAQAHESQRFDSRVQSIFLSGLVGLKCLYEWYTNSVILCDFTDNVELLSASVLCCLDSCQETSAIESCEDAVMTIDAVIRQKQGLNHPHQD